MQRIKFISFFCLMLMLSVSVAQGSTKKGNQELDSRQQFDVFMQKMSSSYELPMNELMIKTAKYFIGKPYVASTLEVGDTEMLIVNFDEFDCTTFVETCMALCLTMKSDDKTYENYVNQLQKIRYRGGQIDGYTSRLHYMRDWVYDNQEKGITTDLSGDLGGNKLSKKTNFMSSNPQYYKQLENNRNNVEQIKQIENVIDERDSYIVVSKAKITEIGKLVNSGDIIIFATDISGLDYSHIGIAYKESGVLKFIHASSRAKKVIIETQSLNKYCLSSKRCTGVSILRLSE